MKKNRFVSIILLMLTFVSSFVPSVSALEPLELECSNAILVDVNHGEILHEKNAYDKAYPASITKVMTALLVLEAIDAGELTLDTLVTVSETAAKKQYSNESTAISFSIQ